MNRRTFISGMAVGLAHDAVGTFSFSIKQLRTLAETGGWTENPGVGGSIPSLPTMFFNQLPVTEFFPLE